MPQTAESRERLLLAAAEMVSADPDQNVSVREICRRAGVQLPTLYHFFESKRGLIEAVIDFGFDRLVALSSSVDADALDPIDGIARIWDAHVAFGLDNPSFYVLMYGRVAPGREAPGSEKATAQLFSRVSVGAAQGLLAVSAEEATARLLASVTGLVLHLISTGSPDARLSESLRGVALRSIVRENEPARPVPPDRQVATHAGALLAALDGTDDGLEREERALLVKWLRALESIGQVNK